MLIKFVVSQLIRTLADKSSESQYAHWFMSIIISYMKEHSISMDQARYATSSVEKYLDTATVKASNF